MALRLTTLQQLQKKKMRTDEKTNQKRKKEMNSTYTICLK